VPNWTGTPIGHKNRLPWFPQPKLEIPIKLDPGDFDWQESRPTAPWWLREFALSGPWYLKHIELSRGDITTILLQGCDAPPAKVSSEPMGPPRKRERNKSQRVIAENAIRGIWPERHLRP
jgi:hypothetical protein